MGRTCSKSFFFLMFKLLNVQKPPRGRCYYYYHSLFLDEERELRRPVWGSTVS